MTSLWSVLFPLISLAISLRIWYLALHCGWSRVLRAFTWYVGFSCVSTLVLLPVLIWGSHPGRLQSTLNSIYSNGYYAFSLIGLTLILAVVYQLFRYTVGSEARALVHIVGLFAIGTLTAAAGFGLPAALKSGSQSDCCRLVQFACVVMRAGPWIVTAMLLTLFVCKLTLGVRWGTSVSLIVAGITAYYVIDLAVSYIEFVQGRSTLTSRMTVQASGLVWLVLWWIAVRSEPALPGTRSLPPKTWQFG